MASIISTSKCEADELVLLLIHYLPVGLKKLWHRAEDVLHMLRCGGITHYNDTNRIGILLRNQKRVILEPNIFNKKRWYCFHTEREFDDPKQQRDALVGNDRPQIGKDYFINLDIDFKYITGAKKTTKDGNARDKCNTGKENNKVSGDTNVNMSKDSGTDTNNKSLGATAINTKQNTSQQPTKTSNPSIINETGMCLSRINFTESVLDITNKHLKTCRNELHVIDRRKFGFEVMTDLGCNFCKKTFTVNSGPEAEEAQEEQTDTPKQRGRKQRPINMMMANAIHASAITIAQITGLCGEIGCVSPSERAQHDSARKRKDAILAEAEEVFAANRREHVKMCKVLCPDQTIKHKDGDGKEHHLCHGAVSADGAGDKRAYKHIITGKQHCTVVFSLITGRVLALKHDQLHCKRCAVRLTHVMAQQNKRFDEITEDDLKHDGPCYINSKHGPAVAEEHALEYLAEYLLVDPKTKKLRPDDEAILVDWFVADGDTKGAIRFIKKQASIIPEFNGTAEYIPDIGHFIKCISNALYKLAAECVELRGVSLLEATRIKAITSDITKIIKSYKAMMEEVKQQFKEDDSVLGAKLNEVTFAIAPTVNDDADVFCELSIRNMRGLLSPSNALNFHNV